MGAFLVLPPDAGPVAMLLFASLPSLVLALLLKDRDGALAFTAAGASSPPRRPCSGWPCGAGFWGSESRCC